MMVFLVVAALFGCMFLTWCFFGKTDAIIIGVRYHENAPRSGKAAPWLYTKAGDRFWRVSQIQQRSRHWSEWSHHSDNVFDDRKGQHSVKAIPNQAFVLGKKTFLRLERLEYRSFPIQFVGVVDRATVGSKIGLDAREQSWSPSMQRGSAANVSVAVPKTGNLVMQLYGSGQIASVAPAMVSPRGFEGIASLRFDPAREVSLSEIGLIGDRSSDDGNTEAGPNYFGILPQVPDNTGDHPSLAYRSRLHEFTDRPWYRVRRGPIIALVGTPPPSPISSVTLPPLRMPRSESQLWRRLCLPDDFETPKGTEVHFHIRPGSWKGREEEQSQFAMLTNTLEVVLHRELPPPGRVYAWVQNPFDFQRGFSVETEDAELLAHEILAPDADGVRELAGTDRLLLRPQQTHWIRGEASGALEWLTVEDAEGASTSIAFHQRYDYSIPGETPPFLSQPLERWPARLHATWRSSSGLQRATVDIPKKIEGRILRLPPFVATPVLPD